MSNHILERKYKIQKQLSEESGYDLKIYVENSHKNVQEITKKYNLSFKYVDRNPAEIQVNDTEIFTNKTAVLT